MAQLVGFYPESALLITIMAKRHGNLFDKIISHDNLHVAYRKARKGKSRMYNVMRFERDVAGGLEHVRNLLFSRQFTTSHYQEKIIYEPKKRTIYVLPFMPDRIVQHALMNVIEPIWEKLFISDSYACLVGKGIHAGSRRTMDFVRKYKYCLKCDISKFYPSIDHDILWAIICRKIKCPGTLWLLEDIVYSISGGKNTPIGNYTSQWFGNLYLNELDHVMKHKYKVKGYLRYCDDFCLFHDDKKHLAKMAIIIKEFVWSKLKLTLSKCDLFPVSRGVDFLGYRHFNKYNLLRKSTAKRVKRRLRELPLLLERQIITKDQFRSSLASTKGWLKWANTHNFVIATKLNELDELGDD